MSVVRARVLLLAAALVTACTPAVPAVDLRFGDLHVENGTSMPVVLVVGGSIRVEIPPRSTAGLRASDLPGKPWDVAVRHAISGRDLVTIVIAEDPVDAGSLQQGSGARVDLSCGRLDVWVGPPMHGPMPEPGRPGDCDP